MRTLAIIRRVITEMIRDKRTLVLMLVAPLLMITLLNFVFSSNSDTKLSIGVNDSVPSALVDTLQDQKIDITTYSSDKSIKQQIKEDHLDGFITMHDQKLAVYYENENPTNTAQLKGLLGASMTTNKLKELTAALQKASQATGQIPDMQNLSIENHYVYGSENTNFFDKIFPILIGFLVFFFVFLISGIALLRERSTGTLDRLLATPVKRSEIIFGYLVGYGLFAIVQTLLIVLYSIAVLNLEIAGSLFLVLGINLLVALAALSMGIFISTFANSEFQMMQFIPIVVIPQILFSGIIPLDTMANWVRILGYFFPLSYAGNALTAVIVRGENLTSSSLLLDLGMLLVFTIGFTILNIFGLRRYRKV